MILRITSMTSKGSASGTGINGDPRKTQYTQPLRTNRSIRLSKEWTPISIFCS